MKAAAELREGAARLARITIQTAITTAVLFSGPRALGDALQGWDRDPVERRTVFHRSPIMRVNGFKGT
ncbi:MAG: hypothetical protein H0V07_12560 [Propionibacteriales bacterium]|nr:hypothetical protein [Propionibacteriales bacterium]